MMKKIAVRGMIALSCAVALCLFFSGTIRTITTAKVRYTSARQGKFEQVTLLTGKVCFSEAEEYFIPLPQDVSLTVTGVFVKPGARVEAGGRLLGAAIADYDKTAKSLQDDYDKAEATLRELDRKNGDVRLSRNETSWMEAWYAATSASQARRDCQTDVAALLALEGLKMSDGEAPEGASDELIAAIQALKDAEKASREADEALEKLNRYAVADDVWEYLTEKKSCEETMQSCEASLAELKLLARTCEAVPAPHAGYIVETLVEKGGSVSSTTAVVTLTPEDLAPVIRVDISDVRQTVSSGSPVTIETPRYGRQDTAVIATGVTSDGVRYADIEITKDMISGYGSLSAMVGEELQLRLSSRSQEATCLLSPSAVRGSGDSRYVYIAVKESSTFGGTQTRVEKRGVTVLGESESAVSVAEDLNRLQIIVMEDRAIKEGDLVMEYTE